MSNTVSWAATAAAVLNAIPAILGGVLWYRPLAVGGSGVRTFWILLRVGQAAALLFAVFAGLVAAAGHRPSEGLFWLYALLPLGVAFVAEQLRIASAQTILDQRGLSGADAVAELPEEDQNALVEAIVRREIGVMALSALVVVVLLARAAGTDAGM